jgi:putative transposase
LGGEALRFTGATSGKRLNGQRFVSWRHAKDKTLAWLLWYNQARLHWTLAYVSPLQFESEWLARQANS